MHDTARMLIVALCLAAPTAASAQLVNLYSHLPGEAPKGLHGDLELASDWRTGNVDYLELTGGLEGSWHQGDSSVFVLGEGEHALDAGKLILGHTLAQVRYRWQANDFLAPELFVQNETAAVRRLALRVLYGGDLRFAMRVGKSFDVSAGFGVMGEHEAIVGDTLPDAGQVTDDVRYTTYLAFEVPLVKHVHLTEVGFFQDSATDAFDVRLSSYTGLFGSVNDWLDLGVIFSVAYDSQPPASVKPTDTALRTFLSVDI